MSFQWNPQFPPEREVQKPPPVLFFLGLYVIVEVFALAMVLPDLPKSGAVPWDRLIHDALILPFFCWLGQSCLGYWLAYDIPARQAADHNTARWHQITGWQRQSRSGLAVLDSVILTPEPDLAERMLGLDGTPPDNPGQVMALADIVAADDTLRLSAVLETLLTPLVARLMQAVKDDSFEIVMQCDDADLSGQVRAAWNQVGLPGRPVIRWLDERREVGFADPWFDSEPRPYWDTRDTTPRYRLVLAWHLNRVKPDDEAKESEAAVALLLASPARMQEKPELKHQAWLLRQVTSDADQVDRSLATLLKAEQVPQESIRHVWHSRLKGLAQHATQGAVREADLKTEDHALDRAVGPQARVVRWVLPALAAKMAQFGQGAQLIALPQGERVVLHLVAKEPARVALPWKQEYGYNPLFGPEVGMCASIWAVAMLLSPGGWSTTDTILTWAIAGLMVLMFLLRHPGPVVALADWILSYW